MWSQDHLAGLVGIHGRHMGKYEVGRAMPNAETVVKLAQTLNISIDYLLRDDMEEDNSVQMALHDQNLLHKFQAIGKMDEDDRHVIDSLIDAYIKKQQIEKILQK